MFSQSWRGLREPGYQQASPITAIGVREVSFDKDEIDFFSTGRFVSQNLKINFKVYSETVDNQLSTVRNDLTSRKRSLKKV